MVDFTNGGVDIVCIDSIDLRGDINLNDIPYEVADAVLFTTFFIFGPDVFLINSQAQIAATDVNFDGNVLTVGDLVYLIRIITGDVEPGRKVPPFAHSALVGTTLNHSAATVSIVSQADIGAGQFIFEHSGYRLGEPYLINGASRMSLKYSDDGNTLKVLIYSMEKGARIDADAQNVLVIPTFGTGDIELREVNLSDYYGNMLTVTEENRQIVPRTFVLHQNYPNPFNSRTRIAYEVPRAAHVTIEVFNVVGRHVRTLASRHESAGIHTVEWDGLDQSGNAVASGIYLYRLTVDGAVVGRKMALLK
jgi:hypothetical protein